mmetsp:Transcript_1209/g.1902  ORF Transcript_1209/g.1902 Transcript_1209/m.1902 type:complete len:400 (-) Transcript_1209:758-1957(-)
MRMRLKTFQHLTAFQFDFLRWELEALVQRFDMSFNLFQGEAIDEGVILLRFRAIGYSKNFAIRMSRRSSRWGRLIVNISSLYIRIGSHWSNLLLLLLLLLLVRNLRRRILPIGCFLPLRWRRRSSRTSRKLILLQCLLMPLFQSLHLLLFLMTAVNRLANRTTHRTTHILTTMVVTQHISRTNAVGDHTFLIFALRNMLPQPLHPSTVRCHWALIVLVRTLCRMTQQKKTLLLMTKHLLPIRRLPRGSSRSSRLRLWGSRCRWGRGLLIVRLRYCGSHVGIHLLLLLLHLHRMLLQRYPRLSGHLLPIIRLWSPLDYLLLLRRWSVLLLWLSQGLLLLLNLLLHLLLLLDLLLLHLLLLLLLLLLSRLRLLHPSRLRSNSHRQLLQSLLQSVDIIIRIK